jgi:FkbM family methyltransferase
MGNTGNNFINPTLSAAGLLRLAERVFRRADLHRWALRARSVDAWYRGEPELRLLPLLVKKDQIALDVGAADGVYTFHLRRLARAVIAFEPNPLSAGRLRLAAPEVDVRQHALSDVGGSAVLRVPVKANVVLAGWGTIHEGNTFSEISADVTKTVSVQTERLDDLGLADIGFIKIDVEGHESEVLEGARSTLMTQRPNILVEISAATRGNSADSCSTLLSDLGYLTLYLSGGSTLERFSRVPDRYNALNVIAIPSPA